MAVNSNDDARFKVVEYSPEKAEMIGYSNYSYWKSVIHNFLKKKSAVALLIVFCIFLRCTCNRKIRLS